MSDLKKRINTFIKKRDSNTHRYSSFDFCYEYFYYNKGNLTEDNLQQSCCQLWSYLASWGMIVRGNELQGKSYASLKKVIGYINKHPEFYDVKLDDNDFVDKILKLYDGIEHALGLTMQKNKKTLITKIILGVYACCPAFDSRFCRTFGTNPQGHLSKKKLQRIVDFYRENKSAIDGFCIRTLHFTPPQKIRVV